MGRHASPRVKKTTHKHSKAKLNHLPELRILHRQYEMLQTQNSCGESHILRDRNRIRDTCTLEQTGKPLENPHTQNGAEIRNRESTMPAHSRHSVMIRLNSYSLGFLIFLILERRQNTRLVRLSARLTPCNTQTLTNSLDS